MSINLINSSSAHFGAVRFVAFDSSNEKLISIGEEEGRLYIWNADTLSPASGTTIEDKTANFLVRSAVFPDDFSFLFGGDNNTLTHTDWPDCENYSAFIKSENEIDFVSSKWDTKTIAYSDQHTIHFHDKEKDNIPELNIEYEIKWLDFSRDAKFFAISCSDSTVIIWNASNFTEIFRKKYDLGNCRPSWGPGDFLIIPISAPGKVNIIKVDNLEEHEVQNPSDELSSTTAAALSNKYILALSDNSKKISFLQLNQDYSLTLISTTSYSGSEFSTIAWGNVNTNLFAAGDTEGTIFLFELIENKKKIGNDQENGTESDVQLDDDVNENENIEKNDDELSSKTINDILKDKPNLVVKPRTQPKKAKGKGKQQKLNLAKAPAPKPKKIEPKRKFISDNSDSSEEEENENKNKENNIQNQKSFLDEDDDDFDDIVETENVAVSKPQKTFLNDDDNDDNFDDIDIDIQKKHSSPNAKKIFLSDNDDKELEDIVNSNSNLNDDGIPGYDDIALPDDDEINELGTEKVEIPKTDEKDVGIPAVKNINPYNPLSYLDCSSSTRFIPGSFKQQNGKTDILCWNGEGSIVMYNEGFSDRDKYVEIKPYGNETFYSKKIEEAYQINLATVDKYGYLLATNDTVIYYPHKKYGPEAEIIKKFEFLEDVQLIACGNSFFAVATSRKFLHIFSSAGFELSVITLNGRLITMVGHENYLFVVSGKHHFDLFDVFNRSLLASGILPIHAPLRWAGFNHFDHSVVIESGNYQLLTLSYTEGIRWTPVLDLSNHLKSSSNGLLHLFIVEVFGNQVSGVYLDKDADELETNPFPETLIDIDFEPPTIESLLGNCVLSIINYQNSNDKDKEAKIFDKNLLIKFDSALKENKLLLAYQMAKQMNTTLGIELAIRICDQKGQSGVSERLMKLKDLRNEEEEYDDDSNDFENDESSEEPEPFVRTEKIQQEDEEERIQKTNIFLDRFNNEKEKLKKDDDSDNNNNSNVEEHKDKKNQESESSDDDLDKLDNSYQKVNTSNTENSESFSKEIQKRSKRSHKETNAKVKRSRSKVHTKSSKNKIEEDEDIQNEDNDNNEPEQNESSDESDENDEKERKEKKKSSSNNNDKKKPAKSKSTRKKLFNRRDKPSNMSSLSAFGFS